LAWQLGFPAPAGIAAAAVVATAGSDAVGFAAATPRRVVIGDEPRWIHLVSFVGVDPAWRGHRIARRLYRTLLGELSQQSGTGVLTFAQEGSAGLAVLTEAYREAGFVERDLGRYQPLGLIVKDTPDDGLGRFDQLPSRPPRGAPAAIANAPDDAAFAHYLADPRGARWIRLADSGDAAALAVIAERATGRGVEPFVCVTNFFGSVLALSSAAKLAAGAGRLTHGGCRTVSIPNARPLSGATAPFRAFPGAFVGKFYGRSVADLPQDDQDMNTSVELV
jgi:GNAT superfamily N-acetyltransferase